jgi:hypothetical protein
MRSMSRQDRDHSRSDLIDDADDGLRIRIKQIRIIGRCNLRPADGGAGIVRWFGMIDER